MGDRSYLAIGDVLALLREEFPDVTISKIRFLESRGLLDPERTPSGYRKFYEPDVDRLRWILRQQREHFLPLKVIKGRLERGMGDPDAPEPQLFEMGEPPPEREPQPVLVGAPAGATASAERGAGTVATMVPIAAVAGSGTLSAGGTGNGPVALSSEDRSPPETGAGATRHTAPEGPGPEVSTGGNPPEKAPTTDVPPARKHRSGRAAGTAAESPAREPARETTGEGRRHTSRATAGLPGASLTLAELAHASGLEPAAVEELESFGLIAGRTVAGVHCYDEDAVLIARLAARFAPYGIEARHLRVFKHAADRQTGLFAQVVTPLLRQRNPESRAKAIEDLAELAEMGEALMRCFSQATLRELTGG